ncbi:MAG: hypothetical protein QME94_18860, partial [Anaerolineae bacterium]|nr:hypothetical protein [Anaerolineae bacterium]
HNDYLGILIESGAMGLLAHLSLQLVLIAGSLRAYRRLRQPLHRRLALALLAAQITFAVMSLTDNLVGYFQLYVYHWILVGIVYALPDLERARLAAGSRTAAATYSGGGGP